MTHDVETTILSFATHLEDPRSDPHRKARDRRWLDESGRATRDGIALVSALVDQTGTRTSFRNIG